MIAWPFSSLTPLRYGALIADPPWSYRLHSEKGHAKSPHAHYACLGTRDIAALPVDQLAAPHCALVMWATAPMLPDALLVMRAWGFTFKTAGAWGKLGRANTGKLAFGTGYILRSAAEFFLVGTIGKPKVRSRGVRNLIMAPVQEHSRKPDEMHEAVERLYHGPYAELFARRVRPGWDAWGSQV
jgi:N6-adenosine-specific RNA methylase IME4